MIRAVARRWADASLPRKLAVIAVLPVLCLVASTAAFLSVHQAQRAADAEFRRGQAVLAQLEELLRLVVDVETAGRGFAATGDASFLAPRDVARDRIPDLLHELERGLDDVLDGGAAGLGLADAANERIMRTDEVIAARAAGPVEPAQLARSLAAGQEAMDRFRTIVDELRLAVGDVVRAREAEVTRAFGRQLAIVVAGASVGTVGGLALAFLIARQLALRIAALAERGRRLERGEPLDAPGTAGDELGQLDRTLHAAAVLLAEREQAAEAARLVAVHASAAKSDFLSRVSHELRTPLSSIIGFGQLLLTDGQRPDVEAAAGQIVRAGRHLLELINEMLDLTQIESGRLPVSIEPVAVAELVESVVELMAPVAAAGSVEIEVAAGVDRATYVRADRQRLKQILLNLVANGVKYNRQYGLLHLRWDRDGGRVRVSVRDTGPGIPADKRDLIFAPFERLGAEATGLEGSGLGLALSRRLADAMAGTIGFDSVEGEGSTFWVELPAADGPTATTTAAPSAADAAVTVPPATSGTLLYIEDNLSNVRLVESILARRPGVELLAAMQADLGIDLAVHHRPGLVLLDLNLPDRPGEEVLGRLKAEPATRDVPVVVVSADATPGQIRRLLASGAADYLTKPIDLERFLEIVDGHLGGGIGPGPGARHVAGDARPPDAGPHAEGAAVEGGDQVATTPRVDERQLADLAQLDRQGGGIHRLVSVFASELASRLDELDTLAGEPPERRRAALHRLRGSVSTFGAARLAALIDRYEAVVAADGDRTAVAGVVAALRAEGDAVVAELERRFPPPDAG